MKCQYKFKIFKSELCSFHSAGNCRWGSRCTFAHDLNELRCLPDLNKTKICEDWQNGICKLDSASCKFAHGLVELKKTNAFCDMHRNGQCSSADCRFSHDPDEIETEYVIERRKVKGNIKDTEFYLKSTKLSSDESVIPSFGLIKWEALLEYRTLFNALCSQTETVEFFCRMPYEE